MTTLARRTDPSSSHRAIADLFESGKLDTHKEAARQLVADHPGQSYKRLYEIHVRESQRAGHYQIFSDAPALMRRLRQVARAGDKKFCRICNSKVLTWWPK